MLVRVTRARVAGVLVGALTTAVCSLAHADSDERRDYGLFSLEAIATRWAPIPRLTLSGSSAPRLLVGLQSPQVGALTTYGVGGDFGVRVGALDLSIVHVRYSTTTDSVDGAAEASEAPVDVVTSSLNVVELGVPLLVPPRVGVQWVGDWFKVGAALEWGLTYAWATASMSDPLNGSTSGGMDAWSGYVRADLSACVAMHRVTGDDGQRGEGATWGCLVVMPTLYDFGWFGGQSIGVRVDL